MGSIKDLEINFSGDPLQSRLHWHILPICLSGLPANRTFDTAGHAKISDKLAASCSTLCSQWTSWIQLSASLPHPHSAFFSPRAFSPFCTLYIHSMGDHSQLSNLLWGQGSLSSHLLIQFTLCPLDAHCWTGRIWLWSYLLPVLTLS